MGAGRPLLPLRGGSPARERKYGQSTVVSGRWILWDDRIESLNRGSDLGEHSLIMSTVRRGLSEQRKKGDCAGILSKLVGLVGGGDIRDFNSQREGEDLKEF